jgi:hypothetical protein
LFSTGDTGVGSGGQGNSEDEEVWEGKMMGEEELGGTVAEFLLEE